ncbi:phenylalanyl-tRNA beta subunit, putative [Babesia ovis]|uniref:Phenylalanyl-tRNA beta subunit, putative n=1 Tax=Babesia ovis TaxID=5869 RepID=A0A9W5WV41_BABOV|nr:phenylalanyl-tRNA beta subunit, putative [Babesia ovis]
MATVASPVCQPQAARLGFHQRRYRLVPHTIQRLRRLQGSVCKCCCCSLSGFPSDPPSTVRSTDSDLGGHFSSQVSLPDWVEIGKSDASSAPESLLRQASSLSYRNLEEFTTDSVQECVQPPKTVTSYYDALHWLCRTMAHLESLERQGFGQEHRKRQLQQLSMKRQNVTSNIDITSSVTTVSGYADLGITTASGSVDLGITNVSNYADPGITCDTRHDLVKQILTQWISFDTIFRRAYAELNQIYNRLLRMEINLNLLRTNSLLMLEDEASSQDTPTDPIADSERYCKLVSIWSSKLTALRDRNLSEFGNFVVSTVSQLRLMSVPSAICLVQDYDDEISYIHMPSDDHSSDSIYTHMTPQERDARISNASASFDFGDDEEVPEPLPYTLSVEGVPEYTLDAEDVTAECYDYECPADYVELFDDAAKLVSGYCQDRGINEETSLEYVNRVSNLSIRLVPHMLKACGSIPIFSNDYLDSSIQCIATAGKQSIQEQSTTGTTPPAVVPADITGDHPVAPSPHWTSTNAFISLLNRTNLTTTVTLRCLPSGSYAYRKLVCLSRGTLRDLFLNKRDTTQSVDVGSLLSPSTDGTDSNIQVVCPSLSGPQTVLRALLTEDLASYEIDKIINRWFPKPPTGDWLPSTGESPAEPLAGDQLPPITDIDTLHGVIWSHRLSQFEYLTRRQQQQLLTTAYYPGGNYHHLQSPSASSLDHSSSKILYDSGGFATISDFIPLRSRCDFRNHIPIKYTMRSSKYDYHHGWMQSLFGNELLATGDPTKTLEHLIGPMAPVPNAVVVPLHAGSLSLSVSYRTISEICDCVTDYVFPPLYEQHNGLDTGCINTGTDETATQGKYCYAAGVSTSKLGSVFISRHSNLCLGSQWSNSLDHCEQSQVPVVFYLVCCGPDLCATAVDSGTPDSIHHHLDLMRPVLSGLDYIMSLCVRWGIGTLTLPAALSCGSSSDSQCPTSSESYIRCLATATHLVSGLCHHPFPVAFNLLFPESLEATDVESTVSSIFSSRLGTF